MRYVPFTCVSFHFGFSFCCKCAKVTRNEFFAVAVHSSNMDLQASQRFRHKITIVTYQTVLVYDVFKWVKEHISAKPNNEHDAGTYGYVQ